MSLQPYTAFGGRHFAFAETHSLEQADSRIISFRASTPALDRKGTRINPKGIVASQAFKANPVLAWGHDVYGGWTVPDPLNTIGQVKKWTKGGTGRDSYLDIDGWFSEVNPRAQFLYDMTKEGTIRGASVGIYPLEWHWENEDGNKVLVFDKSELLEVSLVPIPANPEALRRITSALAERGLELPGIKPVDLSPNSLVTAINKAFSTWKRPHP